MNDSPRWATPKQAADHIQLLSDGLIRQAVKDGDLKAYPVGKGRDYRLDLNDVDEWMKSRSYEPRSA